VRIAAAQRVRFPLRIEGCEAAFASPARALRTSPARWSEGARQL